MPESAFSGLGFIFQCGMTVKKKKKEIIIYCQLDGECGGLF